MAFWGIFLLMTAVVSVQCDNNVPKFGCMFKNELLELDTNSPEEIVLGEDRPVMQFKNVADFNDVLNTIIQANRELLHKSFYDDVSELIWFDNHFDVAVNFSIQERAFTRPTYGSFFKKYHPDPRVGLSSGDLAMALFNSVAKQVTLFEDYFYLIAAGNDMPERLLQRLKTNGTSGNRYRTAQLIWPYRYHNHVAGFFKLSIGRRLGYVLMDPGLGLERPIVYMKDGQSPHVGEALGLRKDLIQGNFRFSNEKDNAYFVAESGSSPGQPGTSTQIRQQRVFYYYRKPYCSFRDTTIKPNLAKPWRTIEKRDANGKLKAQVMITMYDLHGERPAERGAVPVKIGFVSYDLNDGKINHKGTITCSNPEECDFEHNERTRNAFDFVEQRLNNEFGKAELIRKIKAMVGLAQKPGFTQTMYEKFLYLTGDPAVDKDGNVGKFVHYGQVTKFQSKDSRSGVTGLLSLGIRALSFGDRKKRIEESEQRYGPLRRMDDSGSGRNNRNPRERK